MLVLEKNKFWDVVEMPREKSHIGCKWIFTFKNKSNGFIECYIARLVVKGFS